MVTHDNELDLACIRRWSKKENEMEKFNIFLKN